MPSALVIDDDTDLRHLMSALLRGADFEVHSEADGEAGLAAALRLRPDVVVLDWLLPRRSGLEVCRAIRDDAGLAGTAVVIVSARSGSADVELGYTCGPDDYLAKPFGGPDLVGRVRSAVARRSAGPPADPTTAAGPEA